MVGVRNRNLTPDLGTGGWLLYLMRCCNLTDWPCTTGDECCSGVCRSSGTCT